MLQNRGTKFCFLSLYSYWKVGALLSNPRTFANYRVNLPSNKRIQYFSQSTDILSTSETDLVLHVSDEIRHFPVKLQEKLARRGITSFLPIQSKSFQHLMDGKDTVLHAPTGSGKTLAYVLPLAAAALPITQSVPSKQNYRNNKMRTERKSSPRIITLLPSRELAQQVGKEWTKFYCADEQASVATVFGGVPIERHTSLLNRSKVTDVIVSTPGRLRELVRGGHLDFTQILTVVIDEADMLLNAGDSPDVMAILEDIADEVGKREENPDYQLVLVSATVNKYVRDFAKEIMDISPKSSSFIQVQGSESRILPRHILPHNHVDLSKTSDAPSVLHWMTPVKSKMYPTVTVDLIYTLSPRLTIVFVPTKSEVETVGAFLSSKLSSYNIRVLHGDMAQSQRTRTIAIIREGDRELQNQVLVATDVASRGLDLPNVDLVVQFGIPRVAGKEGTYSVDLYTHRTGRAGRVGKANVQFQNEQLMEANSIILYDMASGEGKLVKDLAADVESSLDIQIRPKAIPSTATILEAGYDRAIEQLSKHPVDESLVSFFRDRLENDNRIDLSNHESLMNHICRALVALSNIDLSISPQENRCSLITGDPADRTLSVYRDDGVAVSPTEVTKFCKSFGSGKLGRILTTVTGSAVLDLPSHRARELLKKFDNNPNHDEFLHWKIEECQTMPELKQFP
jgi:superfamily II DNA/RNA helicase